MRTLAWLPWVAALVLTAGCGGCDDSGTGASGAGSEGGGPTGGSGPVCTDCTPVGDTTYALPSPAGATVWTTTTMDKVLREAQPPTTEGAEIEVFAAKNEHEPFQIVVHAPGGGTATLALSELAGPGVIDRVEIERVEYVSIAEPSDPGGIPSGRIPDALVPTSFGTAEPLPPGENQPFWITVTVPPSAPAGDYTATLTVDVGGSTSEIPVRLHVFDFALPAEIGFDGNWNASFEALGGGESLEAVQSRSRTSSTSTGWCPRRSPGPRA
jgi:hypothetical protein